MATKKEQQPMLVSKRQICQDIQGWIVRILSGVLIIKKSKHTKEHCWKLNGKSPSKE